MRIWQRWGSALAVIGAALIGYQLGSIRTAEAYAPREQRDPVKTLLQADRAFDDATSLYGVEGWLGHFSDDGVLLPAGEAMAVGKDAARAYLEPRFRSRAFALRWEPIDAQASGELGYTYGVSKSTRLDADGQTVVSYGKYVTIWRRQADGTWKVSVTIDNSSPAPKK